MERLSQAELVKVITLQVVGTEIPDLLCFANVQCELCGLWFAMGKMWCTLVDASQNLISMSLTLLRPQISK